MKLDKKMMIIIISIILNIVFLILYLTKKSGGSPPGKGYCCDQSTNCPYVQEIEKNQTNQTLCAQFTSQEKCNTANNTNITFPGTGGAKFQQCGWDGDKCVADWSQEGCLKDERCCFDENPKNGGVQCGTRSTNTE